MKDAKVIGDAWELTKKAANDFYQPGKFTTFIGYEWSSSPDGKNLHRNVIFNADHAPLPFTADESSRPEDLWSYLESVRARGIDVIAIPHNGNASGGLMFDWNMSDGKPIDEAYALRPSTSDCAYPSISSAALLTNVQRPVASTPYTPVSIAFRIALISCCSAVACIRRVKQGACHAGAIDSEHAYEE